jgi:hypothetical protein
VRPRRCGFGMPLEQLDPETREAVEDFRRYLEGKVALAVDGLTYVELDDPRAVHVAPKREAS